MRETITLDTPDEATVDTEVVSCDICGEYDKQCYSFYWSRSGDLLQQCGFTSNRHVCISCLSKFVDVF